MRDPDLTVLDIATYALGVLTITVGLVIFSLGCIANYRHAPARTIAPADCSAAPACPSGQTRDPLNCRCVVGAAPQK